MKKIKDNKIASYIIIGIVIAFMFLGRFIPIQGIGWQPLGLIFVFVGTMILWMLFGLVWPSLLCFVALGFLSFPVTETSAGWNFGSILASSFGDQTWVFLLFTFVLMFALIQTPIFKRIAIAFVNNKLARTNGRLFFFLFMLGVLVIGCFTSPTVLFAIMLPILNEIFFLAKVKKGDKLGKYMMLCMCFTIAISSGMTPIAHVFCTSAISAAEKILKYELNFSILKYCAFAIPLGLVAFGIMIGTFLLIIKKQDVVCLTSVNISSIKKSMPAMDAQEIISIIVFSIVIILWVLPELLETAAPSFYDIMHNTLGIAIPPMIGCTILAIIQFKNKPILDITEAFKKNIPWSSLLVCAAALALGGAFKSTGLFDFLQSAFEKGFSHFPGIALLIVLVVWTLVETNFSSNLVTASLVGALSALILPSVPSLNITAVVCVLGCLSGFAFATPPAHPNTALMVDSGYVNSKQALGFGMMTAGYSAIAALLVGYPIAMAIFK